MPEKWEQPPLPRYQAHGMRSVDRLDAGRKWVEAAIRGRYQTGVRMKPLYRLEMFRWGVGEAARGAIRLTLERAGII